MKNITFTMLKPDSVSKGNIGKIIDKIIQDGFEIVAMKYTRLSIEDASEFYSIHSERPFFGDLISYMTGGPIVAAVLKKENAVEDFRKLIGSTNPLEAEKGTIRNLFADSISENAIHGSDSDENAIIESSFLFEKDEMFQ
ncbi:MAG: nucleoside-diphosphate kinase [Bacteroidetes bacterium MED-G13]|nr:MAG: nucleoside-diphosphate kinase [Bacteroidetes bacterium MED-G13]